MIYYLNTGNGRAFVKSNLSNILAELLQKSDTRSGITSQMVGYGFRAIKKANKELKEYLTRRALYEVINYGLLDQRRPSDFDQKKVEFAQNAILKKLFSLNETVTDSDMTYRYNTTADADALENQIYSAVNNATKYDPNEISSDVVRAISLKLDRLYTTENYEELKKAVYAMITGEIDKRVNEFILMNGLNNAYDLLNFVDDFYLEPLCRYIVSTLLPDATGKVNAAKAACATYAKGGLLMALKKAEMNQALKKYKDAVARAITLTIAVQIIRELTESPSGYLEKLRKGDNTNYAGIRNLQKLLENDGTDYKDMYATLAKEFRATEDDIMTVYLPSLAELATGSDNTDWAENNFFDQLYQESVIAQQDITRGLEKIRVPMRTSASGKGLKDIIGRIDPDNNLFIKCLCISCFIVGAKIGVCYIYNGELAAANLIKHLRNNLIVMLFFVTDIDSITSLCNCTLECFPDGSGFFGEAHCNKTLSNLFLLVLQFRNSLPSLSRNFILAVTKVLNRLQ